MLLQEQRNCNQLQAGGQNWDLTDGGDDESFDDKAPCFPVEATADVPTDKQTAVGRWDKCDDRPKNWALLPEVWVIEETDETPGTFKEYLQERAKYLLGEYGVSVWTARVQV